MDALAGEHGRTRRVLHHDDLRRVACSNRVHRRRHNLGIAALEGFHYRNALLSADGLIELGNGSSDHLTIGAGSTGMPDFNSDVLRQRERRSIDH